MFLTTNSTKPCTKATPTRGDQSKVEHVACRLLPFSCDAPHYGSARYLHSPLRHTTASPLATAHGLLHNMDITGMRVRHRALATCNITGSSHQPPAATFGITALSFNRALRNNVHDSRGPRAHGLIHLCVQCVCILRKNNAG